MMRGLAIALTVWACWSLAPCPAGAESGKSAKGADGKASSLDPERANSESLRRVEAGNKRNQEINRIVTEYRTGALDGAAARKRLYPLLSAQAAEQGKSVDRQIAQLRQELAAQETLKRNAKQWVQMRMDTLLDGGSPAKSKSEGAK